MNELSLPVSGRLVRLEWLDSELTILRTASGTPVGTTAVAAGPAGLLKVEFLCIDKGQRGYGAGSEACRLLIDRATADGWKRLRASAPVHMGLSLYFWMRMGFHPLFGGGGAEEIVFELDLPSMQFLPWQGGHKHGAVLPLQESDR